MAKVSLYNKGKREWIINDGKEVVKVGPGKAAQMSSAVAERYAADYPKDFVVGGEGAGKVHNEYRRLKKENAELKKQLEAGADKGLKKKVASLEKEKSELEGKYLEAVSKYDEAADKIIELQKEVEELKKASTADES